jgi:hypothetical protein
LRQGWPAVIGPELLNTTPNRWRDAHHGGGCHRAAPDVRHLLGDAVDHAVAVRENAAVGDAEVEVLSGDALGPDERVGHDRDLDELERAASGIGRG